MYNRVTIIVLDSAGVGALPDAHLYGDEGSDTLGNLSRAVGGLRLPNLQALGLGNIHGIQGVPPAEYPLASYGKMAEASPGKDTTTGHWEMAGVKLDEPFPTYPDGFPKEIMDAFEAATGKKPLGNKPASGTEIIEELGEEHVRTGRPIVYTSADSVFQVAAHTDVIGLDDLYGICEAARKILVPPHGVGRVIARPFTGSPGAFTRTVDRKDFSLAPPKDTLLDIAKKDGYHVVGVGKIEDIFAGRGLTGSVHTVSNMDGVDKTLDALSDIGRGIVYANLVEFDMLYGHRNDSEGYARALTEFDGRLPEFLDILGADDILFITADHGCDPTTPSTDHSREFVPLLCARNLCGLGPGRKRGLLRPRQDRSSRVGPGHRTRERFSK